MLVCVVMVSVRQASQAIKVCLWLYGFIWCIQCDDCQTVLGGTGSIHWVQTVSNIFIDLDNISKSQQHQIFKNFKSCTWKNILTNTLMHMHTNIHMHKHTHAQTCIDIHDVHMQWCTPSLSLTHTHIHVCMHTHTHTHTHTPCTLDS